MLEIKRNKTMIHLQNLWIGERRVENMHICPQRKRVDQIVVRASRNLKIQNVIEILRSVTELERTIVHTDLHQAHKALIRSVRMGLQIHRELGNALQSLGKSLMEYG